MFLRLKAEEHRTRIGDLMGHSVSVCARWEDGPCKKLHLGWPQCRELQQELRVQLSKNSFVALIK